MPLSHRRLSSRNWHPDCARHVPYGIWMCRGWAYHSCKLSQWLASQFGPEIPSNLLQELLWCVRSVRACAIWLPEKWSEGKIGINPGLQFAPEKLTIGITIDFYPSLHKYEGCQLLIADHCTKECHSSQALDLVHMVQVTESWSPLCHINLLFWWFEYCATAKYFSFAKNLSVKNWIKPSKY